MDAQVAIPPPTAAGARDLREDVRLRRRFFIRPGILAVLVLCTLGGAAVLMVSPARGYRHNLCDRAGDTPHSSTLRYRNGYC